MNVGELWFADIERICQLQIRSNEEILCYRHDPMKGFHVTDTIQ
jgi:hypothetical protein